MAESNVGKLMPAAVDERKSPPKRKSRSSARRLPGWSGGLSEEELARPGGILLSMLIHHANEKGHKLTEMARELNVTYSYIAQLRNSARQVAHVSPEFVTACALYLGCPRITVMFAAGQINAEDVFEDPLEMCTALPAALRFIQNNPTFGPIMPPKVFSVSKQLQLFIVTLFEAAEGRTLLPGRQSMADVAKTMQEYARKRAKLTQQVAVARKAKKRNKG